MDIVYSSLVCDKKNFVSITTPRGTYAGNGKSMINNDGKEYINSRPRRSVIEANNGVVQIGGNSKLIKNGNVVHFMCNQGFPLYFLVKKVKCRGEFYFANGYLLESLNYPDVEDEVKGIVLKKKIAVLIFIMGALATFMLLKAANWLSFEDQIVFWV